jgi:hypothetical protein
MNSTRNIFSRILHCSLLSLLMPRDVPLPFACLVKSCMGPHPVVGSRLFSSSPFKTHDHKISLVLRNHFVGISVVLNLMTSSDFRGFVLKTT